MDDNEIILYAADGCGGCQKMKELLDKRGLSYLEKNITRDPEYLEEMRQKGSSTVPTVIFRGKMVIGLRPNMMNRMLDEAGL
ncbi:MAG: glutaredoxin family protein [Bacillaceae bacterium]|nr:glutaredoxin family protein [Bacillaceae bacterium]